MTKLANQIASRVQCGARGSCVVFANELCKASVRGFDVIEGLVKFRGSVPFDHVWIETARARIDPTLEQFRFFDLASVEYLPERIYAPADFRREIKNHPSYKNFEKLLLTA